MPVEPQRYDLMSQSSRRQLRELYAREQGNLCHHCKLSLDGPAPKAKLNYSLFPMGFFEHPVHLHHDHDTNLTIGAVHSVCNAVLWQYHGE